MKKIFIVLIICCALSILVGGCIVTNNKPNVDDSISDNIDQEIKEGEVDEPITESIEIDNSGSENISSDDVSSGKNNMENDNVSNTNVIKQDTVKENTVEQEKPKQEIKTVVPEQKTEPKAEPKQQTEWEKLGISEYDYYNKPMWSWARVDFSINEYGNFERTHQACIDAGNNMEDIISFSCTNINSYSGDYLGDMLKVKK